MNYFYMGEKAARDYDCCIISTQQSNIVFRSIGVYNAAL